MTLAPQSRGRAAALVAAVLASAAVVVPSVSSAPTAQAAPDDIIAIVVEGTGNGHGRGMSQWGAYGYAVDHGWNWQQILGHYYGGTISGTTAANQRIDVRLTKYDGMGDVGVISHGSGVRWNGQTAPAMRANETSSGVFDIYKANTVACPSSTSLTVPDGPVVEQSAYNADAKRVQRFLRSFHPPAAGIVIDGYFGPQTRGFLAAWQASRALQIDGSRWNTDDAASARAQIAASGSSVNWTKIGTHVQSVGSPVRFTAADGEAAGTSSSDVLGVCSSGGSITHYRGAVEVVHTSSGNRVVNDVLAENYVRGVIPKEIAASWAYAGNGAGDNAVKAQAVAARSYGLAQNRSYTYDG
ncbi:MAG: SpoIID/LytB domain-containing protein, partial [Ilumatobacter sp.]|nr:SpoIID/LytB domain-containing protein [Ilumatobacter sp.]